MSPKLDEKIKIDRWDGSALKNNLDDQCRAVFISFEYKESHKLINIRLLICFSAVLFALFALLYDYFHPFPASRTVLIICVISYFILMGILTLYTMLIEKGIFMVAYLDDPAGIDPKQVWTLSSSLKRFDDIYNITIEYSDGKPGSKIRKATLSKSVSNWFDEDGVMHNKKFHDAVKSIHDALMIKKDS